MVTMRNRPISLLARAGRFFIPALLVAAAMPAFARREPPRAKPATSYPDVDVHPKDHVAIAAIPYTTGEQCKIFRIDYLKYGFMPIRIIVTNLGDRPVSLRDARIYLYDASGDRIEAAHTIDVDRQLPGPRPPGMGMGIPIGPVWVHRKPKTKDNKVEQDFNQFEYDTLVVEPHATHAGFLFYDISGLGNHPLRGSKLVFSELRNAEGHQLWDFTIHFDKYLAAQH